MRTKMHWENHLNAKTNELTVANIGQFLKSNAEKSFKEMNAHELNFVTEAEFATQLLTKNDYIVGVARGNRQSVINSVKNIAAIGLSLNPATGHAYLVPRDNAICLDISYRGLIKLATDAGIIKWVQAEIVHESDDFRFHGIAEKPEHSFDPFRKDRGDVVGAYCVAKTIDGDYLTTTMSRKELDEIQSLSKTKKAGTPWIAHPNEMRKKVVIKRAAKTWPYSGNRNRLDQAIEIAHKADGFDENDQAPETEFISEKQHMDFVSMLSEIGADTDPKLEKVCDYLRERGILSFETIPANQFNDICKAIKRSASKVNK